MRRVTIIFTALAASAIIVAPAALASSPQQTARQFANGQRHVSTAQLNAALSNPTVQGYQGPGQQGAMQQQAVAGVSHVSAAGATAGSNGGTLPFTGVELSLFVAAGILLVGGGLLVRRIGRSSD
jgi:hypothetical protein